MSLASVSAWTFVRTIVLCSLAWPIIVHIERWLRNQPESWRPFAYSVLLAPFLFPELLVGYAFRDAALTSPLKAECLCASLLFIRIVPIGVIALIGSPVSVVPSASIHCRWMAFRANQWDLAEWRQIVLCYWYGPIRRALPALGLMSLVAFQEFELAALLQTASWTDWFIAAQRMGLNHHEMLHQTLWPLGLQLPLLAGAIFSLSRDRIARTEHTEGIETSKTPSSKYAVTFYLGLAILIGCVMPLCRLGWNLPSGLHLLLRQPAQCIGLGREILVSIAVSLFAGVTTWFTAINIVDVRAAGRLPLAVRRGIMLPGLIGSLLLSLSAEWLFQNPWLRPFYDTPIPWVLALIIWLMPRAVLLQLWLAAITRTESVFLAEVLDSDLRMHVESFAKSTDRTPERTTAPRSVIRPGTLLFRLRDQPRYLAIGLLCYWAYLDLSTAYLLAPTGMASGLVRLYNFMHFGRSAALSAESLIFFGVPLAATLITIRFLKARSQR